MVVVVVVVVVVAAAAAAAAVDDDKEHHACDRSMPSLCYYEQMYHACSLENAKRGVNHQQDWLTGRQSPQLL